MLFLLAVVAGTPSSLAQSVTEADVAALVPSLVPTVERLAGRAFAQVPPVVVENLYVARHHQRVSIAERARAEGRTEAEVRELTARVSHELGEDTLAFYDPPQHRITVLSDTLQDLFVARPDLEPPLVAGDAGGLPDALLLPALRCILAHELVHALQGEAGFFDRQTPRDPSWPAVIEGQATLIGDAVCKGDDDLAPAGLLRLLQAWVDAQNGARSEFAVEYGAATAWLAGATGADLTRSWEVLAAGVPSTDTMRRRARSDCERAGQGMREALDALAGRQAMRQVPETGPLKLSFLYAAHGGFRAAGAASAVCTRTGRGTGGRWFGVGVLEFPDEATADASLAEWRSGWRRFARFVGPLTYEGSVNALPAAHGAAFRVWSFGPKRFHVRAVTVEGYMPRWWRFERFGTRVLVYTADGPMRSGPLSRARSHLRGPLVPAPAVSPPAP